jgi:hypothetical protein
MSTEASPADVLTPGEASTTAELSTPAEVSMSVEASPPADVSTPAEAPMPADPAPGLSSERIAARVAALDAVDELPLAEHVELYQRLHAELQSALAEIDGP